MGGHQLLHAHNTSRGGWSSSGRPLAFLAELRLTWRKRCLLKPLKISGSLTSRRHSATSLIFLLSLCNGETCSGASPVGGWRSAFTAQSPPPPFNCSTVDSGSLWQEAVSASEGVLAVDSSSLIG